MTSRARPMICSFWKMGSGDVLKDAAHHRMRLDREDARVQNAALIADVVAHDIFVWIRARGGIGRKTGSPHPERCLRGLSILVHRRQNKRTKFILHSMIFSSSSTMTTADGIFCSSALAFFCASLRVYVAHIMRSALRAISACAKSRQESYPHPPQFNSSSAEYFPTVRNASCNCSSLYSLRGTGAAA